VHPPRQSKMFEEIGEMWTVGEVIGSLACVLTFEGDDQKVHPHNFYKV